MVRYAAAIAVMIATLLMTIEAIFAQLALSQPELDTKDVLTTRFAGIMGGFYGFAYPAGTIHTSDNYLKRGTGKYFGATHAIGYKLRPQFILHGGFTLWDAKVEITRNLLMKEMKTQYSVDTCALHTGVLFIYNWFFADAIVYTELPLEKDTERVELDGVYTQTNTLPRQYEYGALLGLGTDLVPYNVVIE